MAVAASIDAAIRDEIRRAESRQETADERIVRLHMEDTARRPEWAIRAEMERAVARRLRRRQ